MRARRTIYGRATRHGNADARRAILCAAARHGDGLPAAMPDRDAARDDLPNAIRRSGLLRRSSRLRSRPAGLAAIDMGAADTNLRSVHRHRAVPGRWTGLAG